MKIWTIGHSNQPVAALIEVLTAAGIEHLVDVRRFPMSRRNPQFNAEALAVTLSEAGVAYTHAPDLGGRRTPEPDSVNLGLRDRGFRSYADYMATEDFQNAFAALISLERVAVMCAESLPWHCHRSLIADALIAREIEVGHLYGGKEHRATISPHARVQDGSVAYPALL